MNPQSTAIVLGIMFAFGVVYDVAAYSLWGNNGTISKAMQLIGEGWPIVIVFYGGLAAHFFVPHHSHWPGWWPVLKPVLCLCLGFVAFLVAWTQSADWTP